MTRILLRRSILSAGLLVLSALHASAQPALVDELASFTSAEDSNGLPSEFTEGPDGMLYGVADRSNTRYGSIFRLDPNTRAHSIVAQIDYGAGAGTVGAGTYSGRMVLANDGRLYGTFVVFDNNDSAVFRFDPATNTASVIHLFSVDPVTFVSGPDGGIVQRVRLGSDGWLYGTTMLGNDPATTSGTIFKIDPATETFVQLAHPVLADGFYPSGPLLESAPGVWLGNYASNDSSGACGRLFRIDTNTNTFAHLKSFFYQVEGCSSLYLSLARAADGTVYGTAEFGGGPDDARGSFFRLNTATGAVTQLHHFTPADSMQAPHADLTVGADGQLYTSYMTMLPDGYEKGFVRVDPATGAATKVAQLPSAEGLFGDTAFFLGSSGRWFGATQSPWKAYAISFDDLQAANASGAANGTTSLSATLQAAGAALAGRTVDFTLNGNPVGSATTDVNGVATVNNVSLAGIAPGTYPNAVGASFAGDDQYPAAAGSGSLTVTAPPPPPPSSTPGLMAGLGYIRDGNTRYDFGFIVKERADGADRGGFELRASAPATYAMQGRRKVQTSPARNDRFVARSFTNVVFSDDPTSRPGRRNAPQVDTVLFAGPGSWNGRGGYRFEAFAQDRGEPGRHRESLRVTVYDAANHVVAQFDDELDGGNIESLRLHR